MKLKVITGKHTFRVVHQDTEDTLCFTHDLASAKEIVDFYDKAKEVLLLNTIEKEKIIAKYEEDIRVLDELYSKQIKELKDKIKELTS